MTETIPSSPLIKLFNDPVVIDRIKRRLPRMFWIINIENSRGGIIGMEAGAARKWPIIALLVSIFGEGRVDTHIAINEREINVIVDGRPVSIKTVSQEDLGFNKHHPYTSSSGIKALWSGDQTTARERLKTYQPKADLLLIHVNFKGGRGSLYLITKEVQEDTFKVLGPEKYFRLPKPGQDSRGAEYTVAAIMHFVHHMQMKRIDITWAKPAQGDPLRAFKPWQRWTKYWVSNDSEYDTPSSSGLDSYF